MLVPSGYSIRGGKKKSPDILSLPHPVPITGTRLRYLGRYLDGTVASSASQAGDGGGSIGRGNAIGAAKLRQHAAGRAGEVARVGEAVGHTLAAQAAGARGAGAGVVDDVGLAGVARLGDGGDVAKDVALGEDVGTGADFETVAAGLVPLYVGDKKNLVSHLFTLFSISLLKRCYNRCTLT